MDIARRPLHLQNRDRCQEEDTLIPAGLSVGALGKLQGPSFGISLKNTPTIRGIYHGRQGEGKRSSRSI